MVAPLVAAIAPAAVGGIINMISGRRAQRQADKRAAQAREVAIADRDEERAYYAEQDATRFTRLRDGAIAAGFNPLTALGVGTTMPGGGMELPSGVGQHMPINTSQYWYDGLQAASAELTGEAALRRQTDVLQNRLAQLQLDQLESEAAAGFSPASLSGYGAAGGVYGGGAPAPAQSAGVVPGRAATFNTPFGEVSTNPNYTWVEDIEPAIGEAADLIGAAHAIQMAEPLIDNWFADQWENNFGFSLIPGGLAQRIFDPQPRASTGPINQFAYPPTRWQTPFNP